ncbi:MAG: hypothetical protein ABGZ17_28580 [Planctomycetaceae bacterium]
MRFAGIHLTVSRRFGNRLLSWLVCGVSIGTGLILSLTTVVVRQCAPLAKRLWSSAVLEHMRLRKGGSRQWNPAWQCATATGLLGLILILMQSWSKPTASPAIAPTSPESATDPDHIPEAQISAATASPAVQPIPDDRRRADAPADDWPSAQAGQHARAATASQLDLEVIHDGIVSPPGRLSASRIIASEPVWIQRPLASDSNWSPALKRQRETFEPEAIIPTVARSASKRPLKKIMDVQLLQIELRSLGINRASVGKHVPIEIEATNVGSETLPELLINQRLPPHVRIIAATDAVRLESGELQWDVLNLPPGQTRRVGAVVQPTLAGTVRFSSRTVLRAAVRSTTIVHAHRLALTMTIPDQVPSGRLVRLRFRFSNTGKTRPENLILRLHLPTQFAHPLGRTLDLRIADLPSGTQQVAQLHVRAGQPAEQVVLTAEFVTDGQVITSTADTIRIADQDTARRSQQPTPRNEIPAAR